MVQCKNQTVTSPLNAWIKPGLSNSAILMRKSHSHCLHLDDDCVSLECEQIHELLCMSNRRCEMTTAAYHLTKTREDALELNATGDALALSDFAKVQLLEPRSTVSVFVDFVAEHLMGYGRANQFASDLVSHVNPN